jgi:ubiquinone biosynthesis protein UbiJ
MQYLLLQKALNCPEPFSADMLTDEQQAQTSPERIAQLAAVQKSNLREIRDSLCNRLQTLVNARMPWLR